MRAPASAFGDAPDELAFRIVLWDAMAGRAIWRDTEWRRPVAASALPTRLVWPWPLPSLSATPGVGLAIAVPTATPSPIALATTQSRPTAAPVTTICRVVVPALRLRAGPGTTYAVRGVLALDERVEALARNTASSWLEVRTEVDRRGWIANGPTYVTCDGPVNDLPIGETPLPSRLTVTSRPAVATAPALVAGGPTSVELQTPADGANSRDPITFAWHPNVPLAEGQLYELVFWVPAKGQTHEQGGGSWRPASPAPSVTLDPSPHAPESYRWGVWLGRFDARGEYRRIRYLGGGRSLTVPSSDGRG